MVVGNDRGDAGRPRLWYAEKDAERMYRALRELGDFDPNGTVLLQGKRPNDVVAAVHALEPRIQASKAKGERTLLVFYYSGHAASGGLEMGGDRLPFDQLRGLVAASGAETRIAIVDACEAGLLTQVKGASAVPALAFALPSDDQVSGTAFIASTAVGEQAQESAALGGSFFTHHLEVAMRGAGDADGDGRVTLAEAFASIFASNTTSHCALAFSSLTFALTVARTTSSFASTLRSPAIALISASQSAFIESAVFLRVIAESRNAFASPVTSAATWPLSNEQDAPGARRPRSRSPGTTCLRCRRCTCQRPPRLPWSQLTLSCLFPRACR